ncbi:DinB family protein [Nocardioides coralli]|uniref:DinB family protein n=1 Tax=Nocardioides coralli TaxID=2872154 RepID=UPI001CA39F77|nr:DinB family protein [Nocardioides coralli]QZY30417.1 DinB family protein [Nocardioides coralli]
MTIEPDTKDWTWVLERPCPECGFDAPDLDRARIPQAIRDNATLWEVVLGTDDAAVRPAANVWSPLEYACHVRDVNELFAERVRLMVEQDDPQFPSWDQDVTAEEDDYGSQDPAVVGPQVTEAAEAVAATYERLDPDAWQRPGTRSNGDRFTVDTLARYHLHDLVHHAHDVSHITKRVTVASYDESAPAYVEQQEPVPASVRDVMGGFVALLSSGARVLEVGSGSGRDALELEARGVEVRRTDITPAFVRMLREAGHEADVLDPLTDDLAAPDGEPYDGVWAAASLLHVRREDLPDVMDNLASVTRSGGPLHLAVKEGDGARFSTHGRVAGPRHFTFWREPGLRALLDEAGWDVRDVRRSTGQRDETWLDVLAVRR